jgi:hypothetical protein
MHNISNAFTEIFLPFGLRSKGNGRYLIINWARCPLGEIPPHKDQDLNDHPSIITLDITPDIAGQLSCYGYGHEQLDSIQLYFNPESLIGDVKNWVAYCQRLHLLTQLQNHLRG